MELINWITINLNCKIIGVVATHFHEDCLGGLETFNRRDIPSYGLKETTKLAKAKGVISPKHSFEQRMDIEFGDHHLELEYLGPGHTVDNIVCYYPSEGVLFGGCLVKAYGAGKGNLNDAHEDKWSQTVESAREKYLDARIIIPGHGRPGGEELLNYTIELFQPD